MAKGKSSEGGLDFHYAPRSPSQFAAEEAWRQSRILFLVGPAGGGKTTTALGLALREVINDPKKTLWLTRPLVACDEEMGFLPGSEHDKLSPWMAPYSDCLSSLTNGDLGKLEQSLKGRVNLVPLGMMRGRTVKNGVLIGDELQNSTASQLKCLLTRCGEGGRMILCGDPDQSDRFPAAKSPLLNTMDRLEGIDAVNAVEFTLRDQVRDPLVSKILSRL